MCYTAELSLASFLVTLFFGAPLFYRNNHSDRAMWMSLLGISSMQLAELVIHLDPACDEGVNQVGARLAYISLVFVQPLTSVSSIFIFGNVCFSSAQPISSASFLCLLVAWIGLYPFYIHSYADRLAGSLECVTMDDQCEGLACGLDYEHQKDYTERVYYFLLVLAYPSGCLTSLCSRRFFGWGFFM